MSKKPTRQLGPPSYAIATGLPGRAVTYNWPPEALQALQELAKRFNIPQRRLELTTPHLDE